MKTYFVLEETNATFNAIHSRSPSPSKCSWEVMEKVLRYFLLLTNVFIVADSIFLLIRDKDLYQGEFIEGRHPVSKFFLIMFYLDIELFCMIMVAIVGFVGKLQLILSVAMLHRPLSPAGTKHRNESILYGYSGLMILTSFASLPELDDVLSQLIVALLAFLYALILKDGKRRAYQQVPMNVSVV